MDVHVVNVRNDVRVFSTFEKALAFVSKHNNKVDRCFTFSQEDKQMYDAMMEEHLGNVWSIHRAPDHPMLGVFSGSEECVCLHNRKNAEEYGGCVR